MPDSRQIARDLAIAQACDAARNPHASAHMNAAVGNLISFLIEQKCPAFQTPASPSDANYARRWLEQLARLSDDFPYRIGSECDVKVGTSIFSDAIHDADLPDGEVMLEAAE